MMRTALARAIVLPVVLLAVLLGACRSVHTSVHDALPDTTALVGDQFVHAETRGALDQPAARWWERFEDPVLNTLVEAVLAGNLDLEQAAANVREADARARSARGRRGPALDAGLAAGRRVDNLLGLQRLYSTPLTAQLTASWQADLFGRLRSIERARYADLLASTADHLAVAHSLVAQAARLRVQISLLERQLDLAQAVVSSRTRTLEIVEGRYQRGVPPTSAVDVHLARENLAAARAALPAIERDRDQTYLALDQLLGQKPGRGAGLQALGAPLPNAERPPAGIPAALLDRRPDLAAGRLRVASAVAEVDVSIAALYPDLTLSASAGWSDNGSTELFSAESFVASLLANLTAPLFTSGQLQAEVDVAQARLEGVAAGYAARVLQALREVEDALVAERGLRDELSERTQQRDEALLAENLARDRYRRGLENLLTVLDTERRRAGAEERVLLLQAAVWNARIDLHLALGGDWFADDLENAE